MPFAQGDPQLEASQMGTEATVHSPSESQVAVVVPVEIDLIGAGHGSSSVLADPITTPTFSPA